MRPLVIFGAGGLATEAVWVAEAMQATHGPEMQWEILGYLSDDATQRGKELYGYPVLDSLPRDSSAVWFHCAIGDNKARASAASRLAAEGMHAATLVHPSVIQARGVEIGEGTYVGAGSILSPNAKIGRFVTINQRVLVGHDAVMEDFSQACPGAALTGACRVSRGALIGTNSSVHPRRVVGEDAVVGSNSYVIRNVRPRTSVLGVPARLISGPGALE